MEEVTWHQRQTRQQRRACDQKKKLHKMRSRFQGSAGSSLALLEVLDILNRLEQKNDRYWVYSPVHYMVDFPRMHIATNNK